ncbi:MAG: phosphoribosylanthranilate isomerase, partial [Gammaproteobacteria bacterium]|nr:phosphoribosylanthranilate isomerase [Gammaproteobacteria bacterium]
MSVFVKICGLQDAASVATAVRAGANAVGFVFAESVRRVTPAEASAAVQNIPT